MLGAIDERYGHLVGVAPLQVRVTVDVNQRVRIAGLGTDGGHVCDCLIAEMTAGTRQNDHPLRPFGALDHVTIFHDAGDATSEARRVLRPIRAMANRTAPPKRDSTETSRTTPLVAAVVSAD